MGERAEDIGAGPAEAEQRGQRLMHLRVLTDMLWRDVARGLQPSSPAGPTSVVTCRAVPG